MQGMSAINPLEKFGLANWIFRPHAFRLMGLWLSLFLLDGHWTHSLGLEYPGYSQFPRFTKVLGIPGCCSRCLFFLLPLFIQSLIHLYTLPNGKALLVYLLFLIWVSDTGAYLSGKLLGKHKLIPQVSPGKSWEGVLGGVILSMLIAWIGFTYFNPAATVYWFVLALCTIIIAIFGDLFISILKRRCHLKDTGAVIPGHGGILDRLDSLIAALPIFYFGITWVILQ